ncbi:MAG: hypothetical protein ABJZ55_24860 [Fuerstiella sp.]
MNFLLVLCWSVVRAIIVCSFATPIFVSLRNRILQPHSTTTAARWLSAMAVAPLFMPDLLLGFTYRLASAGFDFSEVATELLYATILLAKAVAIQIVCHWLVPPSNVSSSAIHLWKMSAQTSVKSRLALIRMKLAGPNRSITIGWILGALWCFQEFETAALLQIEQYPIAWTVWLFDAKAANEPLVSCLQYALPAIMIQGLLIAACAIALRGGSSNSPQHGNTVLPSGKASFAIWQSLSVMTIAIGFLLTIFWPIALHSVAGINGLWKLGVTGTFRLGLEQIGKSGLVAILSAVASWKLSRWLFKTKSWRLGLMAIMPGLLSPLVLSLLLLGLFLTPVVRMVYDSWIPLIVAQTLWLLPRAFLLNVAVARTVCSEQTHAADLLKTSNDRKIQSNAHHLNWRLEQRPIWFAVTVLVVLAFWEVTISSILHPVSLQPMVCRLYREMHFGHTEVLAGLTALSVIFPLLALAIGAQIWKLVRQ